MKDSNTYDKTNLNILVFCIIKIREIIGFFQGRLWYVNTESFQKLGHYYIRLHQEIIRISEDIVIDKEDMSEFISYLKESWIFQNKTLGYYRDLMLNGLLEEEIEYDLNPFMDKLQYMCVIYGLSPLPSGAFYGFSMAWPIKEMRLEDIMETNKEIKNNKDLSEESQLVVMDALKAFLDECNISLCVEKLMATCIKEVKAAEEKLFPDEKKKNKVIKVESRLRKAEYKKDTQELVFSLHSTRNPTIVRLAPKENILMSQLWPDRSEYIDGEASRSGQSVNVSRDSDKVLKDIRRKIKEANLKEMIQISTRNKLCTIRIYISSTSIIKE